MNNLKYLTKPSNTHCLAKFVGFSDGKSLNNVISHANSLDECSGSARILLLKIGFKELSLMSDEQVKRCLYGSSE